ncbi:MAG TPA: hypothetical protein VHZ04_00095 [Candidatus Paceibacterota bacterium]|jgi:hypothetical protein|nr:hypothetical protein [Candidatus Paceibacterota bacterium]
MKNKRLITALSILLGLVCVMLAFVYWTTPAGLLPSFFPGHDSTLTIHVKHGIAAFILGLAFFVVAWFVSGKKSAHDAPPREDKHL